jgi:hypothetical protein
MIDTLPTQATIARATLFLSYALCNTGEKISVDRFRHASFHASDHDRAVALILVCADTINRFDIDSRWHAAADDVDRLHALQILAGAVTQREEPRNAAEHVAAWVAALSHDEVWRAIPHMIAVVRETLTAVIRSEEGS